MCNLFITHIQKKKEAYLDRVVNFPPDLLPPPSTGSLTITLDWLSECTNHLYFPTTNMF